MTHSFKTIINKQKLSAAEAEKVLIQLAAGQYNEAQQASILTVFLMRGIQVEELKGFRSAMIQLARTVNLGDNLIDVCGTGGDGKNTFNISTLSAFVIAACGQKVAKHGNFGVSSTCGSSNVMAHLGHSFKSERSELQNSLDESNICFLHAPLFHPAMKAVAPTRRALEVKTFFNMLGPLSNPAQPDTQMIGVFNLNLARQVAYMLEESNSKYAIVHALDGYDEISLTSKVKMFTHEGEYLLNPEDFGCQTLSPVDIYGGLTVDESAKIFSNILEGKGTKAQNAVVAANAGTALFISGQVDTLKQGVDKAMQSLKDKTALQAFHNFIEN